MSKKGLCWIGILLGVRLLVAFAGRRTKRTAPFVQLNIKIMSENGAYNGNRCDG